MKIRHLIIFCLVLFCSSVSVSANTKVLNNSKQFLNEVSNQWEDDYYKEMVVEKGTNSLIKDDEKTKFSTEFDVPKSEAKEITESTNSVESFLDSQDGIYDVKENKEGNIVISSPYQTKRIIVNKILENTYHADSVYYDYEYNQSFLQFSTEEDAKKACDAINMTSSKTIAFPDSIVSEKSIQTKSVSEPYGIQSWGVKKMGLDTLKENVPEEIQDNHVTVAILDTGYNPENYLMKGKTVLKTSKSFRPDKSTTLRDEFGHGAHVTGIIAEGTSENVDLLELPIAGSDGEASLSIIGEALKYAIKQKANVINLSYGLSTFEAKQEGPIDNIISMARKNDIVIVVASGNESLDSNYVYPVCNNKVIGVSALCSDLDFAEYSNYGSRIDFAGPGDDIWSSAPYGKYALYKSSGTSMSAPHIVAAVSMIQLMNPSMSFKTVYNTLKKYSKDLGKPGKDDYYGWGIPILSNLYSDSNLYPNRSKKIPSKVILNQAKYLTPNKVRLSWSKNPNAESYVVYIKTPEDVWKAKANLNKTSYDISLPHTGSFQFAVEAYADGYYSDMSNVINCYRVAKPSLKIVKNKKKYYAVCSSGYLKPQFEVQYSKTKNFKKVFKTKVKKYKTKKKTVYRALLKKVKKKKRYYVRVRCVMKYNNRKYYSDWSKVKSFKGK